MKLLVRFLGLLFLVGVALLALLIYQNWSVLSQPVPLVLTLLLYEITFFPPSGLPVWGVGAVGFLLGVALVVALFFPRQLRLLWENRRLKRRVEELRQELIGPASVASTPMEPSPSSPEEKPLSPPSEPPSHEKEV